MEWWKRSSGLNNENTLLSVAPSQFLVSTSIGSISTVCSIHQLSSVELIKIPRLNPSANGPNTNAMGILGTTLFRRRYVRETWMGISSIYQRQGEPSHIERW